MVAAQWPVVSQRPLAHPRYVLQASCESFVQSYGNEPHAAPFGNWVAHVSVVGSQRWLAHWAEVVHAPPFATHAAHVSAVGAQ
jgi:hypothetical protein